MPAHSEHEPGRRVVFRAAPAVTSDAVRPLPRLAGGAFSAVLALTVLGVIMFGGSAIWTAFEPPGSTRTPLWISPPESGSQGTTVEGERPSTPRRQQLVSSVVRNDDGDSDSSGGGTVARGDESGSSNDSSRSSSGPGSRRD
ncbi:MAG: hypothetical protein ACXWDM_00920 [Nocardioides sp.]